MKKESKVKNVESVINDFVEGKPIESPPSPKLLLSYILSPVQLSRSIPQNTDRENDLFTRIIEGDMETAERDTSTGDKSDLNPSPVHTVSSSEETAIVSTSLEKNTDYSFQAITKVSEIFKPEIIVQKINERQIDDGLREGKEQINTLLCCTDILKKHTAKYSVIFAYCIGEILLVIEESVGRKNYLQWVDETFERSHRRYLEQSRQIARMGSFALILSTLGKNRLLNFDRLRGKGKTKGDLEMVQQQHWQEYNRILTKHPFPVSTGEDDKEVLKHHIDSIITYNNLRKEGVVEAEFDHAALIAGYLKRELEMKMAKQIRKRLDDVTNKVEYLDQYVMNMMVFPEESQERGSQESLRSILSRLINFSERIPLDSPEFSLLCTEINKEIVKKASNYLIQLLEQLEKETLINGGNHEYADLSCHTGC